MVETRQRTLWIRKTDYYRFFSEDAKHPVIFPSEEGGEGDGPICAETREPLQMLMTGRSIWIRPFAGGDGEVRRVAHLWCPGCGEKEPQVRYGSPVYEEELVTVRT